MRTLPFSANAREANPRLLRFGNTNDVKYPDCLQPNLAPLSGQKGQKNKCNSRKVRKVHFPTASFNGPRLEACFFQPPTEDPPISRQ